VSLREDNGFTLIEVVVSAACLMLIISAIATLFVNGNNSSLASQRQSAMTQVANQQIELIHQQVKTIGFQGLAMTSLPAAASATTLPYSATTHLDPNYFAITKSGCGASGAEYQIEANWDDTSEGYATSNEPQFSGCDIGNEPLIASGGGFVTPQKTVSLGSNGTATVDTYVTQTNVGCNASLGNGNCGSDARRVIVAVVPAPGTSGNYDTQPNSPLYVSTIFTNPTPSNAPSSSIGLTLGVSLG
jgi:type II secretory pathway pseudopilin PulG